MSKRAEEFRNVRDWLGYLENEGNAPGHVPEAVADMRRSLAALPQEDVPADVWHVVLQRTGGVPRSERAPRRRPAFRYVGLIALAACVAVAAVIVPRVPNREPPATPTASTALPALVAESQRLERGLSGSAFSLQPSALDLIARDASAGETNWQSSRRALVYRIADLDDELSALNFAPERDRARAEALWRRRVELMHSLAEVERAQEWQNYRTVMF